MLFFFSSFKGALVLIPSLWDPNLDCKCFLQPFYGILYHTVWLFLCKQTTRFDGNCSRLLQRRWCSLKHHSKSHDSSTVAPAKISELDSFETCRAEWKRISRLDTRPRPTGYFFFEEASSSNMNTNDAKTFFKALVPCGKTLKDQQQDKELNRNHIIFL